MNNLNFTSEHNVFRSSLRKFLDREVMPFVYQWEQNNEIPKDIWRKMGEMGYLSLNFPEKYGGQDLDFYFSQIFCEEISKCFSGGFAISALTLAYLSSPFIYKYGSDFIKEKYLPKTLSGSLISAIAIEDFLFNNKDVTTAKLEGEYYIVNGIKRFVINGNIADYIIVEVKTANEKYSLLIIDRSLDGVTSNSINKIGWKAADISDVYFKNVRVNKENIIGKTEENEKHLIGLSQLEKLMLAIMDIANCEMALKYAMAYMNEREAFGRKINRFQVLRHRVANMIAEIETTKEYVYYCCDLHNRGIFALKECLMAKLKTAELITQITNKSLQFLGGYGYTEEFKIARMYRDAQMSAIYGGTAEKLSKIISEIVLDGRDYKSTYVTENLSLKDTESQMVTNNNYNTMEIIEIIKEKAAKSQALGNKFNIHLEDKNIHIDGTGVENIVNIENIAADCTLKTTEENLIKMIEGDLNPMFAMMNGKINIEGDMMVAMKLQSFLL